MHRLLLLALFVVGCLQAKTIYIVPFQGHDPAHYFFNPDSYRDEIAKPFCQLREALERKGYTVRFTWNGDNIADATAVISLNGIHPQLLTNLLQLPRDRCLLFAFEPPVVMPELYNSALTQFFGQIFVMFDDVAAQPGYHKLHFPQPRQQVIDPVPDFSEKKLCVFISGNRFSPHPNELYSERRALVSYFLRSHPEEFDLYGTGWGDLASRVAGKWDTIKRYRFCFCYENMKDQTGYITEKIFDAMIGGAVPVYYGASNIEQYVPKSCFIDRRDFSSLEELYVFLKNMDRNTYESYLKAIRNYYRSPQARLFSIEHFIETVEKALSSCFPPFSSRLEADSASARGACKHF